MLYLGCPMWGYKAWVGKGRLFPPHTPASDFLRLYSRQLNTVEGNTTFYALPSVETVLRWKQETPENFRFCPKISRDISHSGNLVASKRQTQIFIERMRLLGSRLGPIFLQLPPSFSPTQLDELKEFLTFWPRELPLAVEVRHPDFFVEPHIHTLDQVLQDHQVARIIMDTRPLLTGPEAEQKVLLARERKPHLPVHVSITANFAFVRYIGHPTMENNQPFLEEWAKLVGQWLTESMAVYVFCHCPYEEHSPGICAGFYDMVKRLVQQVPALPVLTLPGQQEKPDTGLEQHRLF